MTLSAVFLMEAPTPAHAYLDPGTGSMMLTILLGAIAGGLVMGRLYWKKIKNFISGTQEDSNNDKPTEGSDCQ